MLERVQKQMGFAEESNSSIFCAQIFPEKGAGEASTHLSDIPNWFESTDPLFFLYLQGCMFLEL